MVTSLNAQQEPATSCLCILFASLFIKVKLCSSNYRLILQKNAQNATLTVEFFFFSTEFRPAAIFVYTNV